MSSQAPGSEWGKSQNLSTSGLGFVLAGEHSLEGGTSVQRQRRPKGRPRPCLPEHRAAQHSGSKGAWYLLTSSVALTLGVRDNLGVEDFTVSSGFAGNEHQKGPWEKNP